MTRETLLLAAVQSGALFLAIWLIFRIVPAIPANAKAWIWRIAFLKPLASLLPFAIVTLHVLPASPVQAVVITEGANAPMESATVAVAANPQTVDPLLALWLVGVAGVALHGLVIWIRALQIVRQAQPVTDHSIQSALHELTERAGIGTPVELLCSSKVPSAMLIGGLRPTIVLPASSVAKGAHGDIRLMLAHEVAHLARRDLLWFGVIWAVQSLFFFNPLAWVAARCARLDHESATDRHASHLAEVPIQTYAEMLLRATVVTRTSLAPGSVPMAESYRTIHRRLEAMKHFNARPTIWRKFAVATLALGTVGLLPVYQLAEAAPAPQEPASVKATPTPKKKTVLKAKSDSQRIKLKTTKKGKQIVYFIKPTQDGKWALTDSQGNVKIVSKNVGDVFPHMKAKPVPKVKRTIPAPVPPRASSSIGQQATIAVSGRTDTGVAVSGQGVATGTGVVQAMGGSGQNTGVAVAVSASGKETNVTVGTAALSGQDAVRAGGAVNGQWEGTVGTATYSGTTVATEGRTPTQAASESVSLTLDNCDVHDALRALFRQVKKNYEINMKVSGTVTISARNVSFEAALKSIVRAVDATYRIEDDTYIVTPLEKSE